MQRKTLALAVTMALAATSFQASAQDARDQELAALKQQLAELAAKVQELEDRSDAQSDVNVDTATQLDTLANNSTKVETKGGIKVTSADKNFEASLGGRIHFDAYAFDSDIAATTDTTAFAASTAPRATTSVFETLSTSSASRTSPGPSSPGRSCVSTHSHTASMSRCA